MTPSRQRLARSLARVAFLAATAHFVASCGGGVSAGSSPIVDSATISILPAQAVMFSGLPTTFVLSGGTGSYIVASSNQAVLQVSGGVTGRSVTLVPNPVNADTAVTLTVRDTGSATPVAATVTVKPGTVNNDVTITPTATQSAACGAAICSGGDAEVRVTVSQGGVPLGARGVRFEVVSGDFRIITSPAGTTPEATATSGTTTTDELGVARMRIRVLPEASSQTALLQITDMATGAYRRTSFTVAPSSNAPLNAQPSSIRFTGYFDTQCASGVGADVIVFGGRPPYSITQPGSVGVTPLTVTTSGGRFSVLAMGQCTEGSTIAIVDANGATASVSVTNVPGTATVVPELIVAPTTVSLNSCTGSASIVVAGGQGAPYFASAGSGSLEATVVGSTVTLKRRAASAAVSSPQQAFVTDGQTVKTIEVVLTGTALLTCP